MNQSVVINETRTHADRIIHVWGINGHHITVHYRVMLRDGINDEAVYGGCVGAYPTYADAAQAVFMTFAKNNPGYIGPPHRADVARYAPFMLEKPPARA